MMDLPRAFELIERLAVRITEMEENFAELKDLKARVDSLKSHAHRHNEFGDERSTAP